MLRSNEVEGTASLLISNSNGVTQVDRYQKEINIICKQFPADEFKWKDNSTLTLTFSEAVDILVEDGISREDLIDIKCIPPSEDAIFPIDTVFCFLAVLKMKNGWDDL
jgi:hypothetical protein